MEIREKLISIYTKGMQLLANESSFSVGEDIDKKIFLTNYGYNNQLQIQAYNRIISIYLSRNVIKNRRTFWSSWFNHQDKIVKCSIWSENYTFSLSEHEYDVIQKNIKDAKLNDSADLFDKIYEQLNG